MGATRARNELLLGVEGFGGCHLMQTTQLFFGHEEEEEAGIELDPLAQILGTLSKIFHFPFKN